MRVWSKLTAPDGMPVFAETDMRTSETYRYDETNILGKRREREALDQTLYKRLAQQVLYRLTPLTQQRLDSIRSQYQQDSGQTQSTAVPGASAP